MNLRLQKDEDTDSFSSLKSSGADLDDYREQLTRERTARTLTLRRVQRPMISHILSKNQPTSMMSITDPLIDPGNFPFLDPNYAISQLSNGNPTTLTEFLDNISQCTQHTPRLAQNLIRHPDIPEAFIHALNAGFSEQLIISILKTLIVIFPLSAENQNIYIDAGLTFFLFDSLSSKSLPLLEVSVYLTAVIAEHSSYARDAILSFGLYEFLIQIAQSEVNEQLTIQACEALHKIFSNRTPIEASILKSCVPQMASLFSLHSIQAVNIVLLCFVQMTNKSNALVFTIYDEGLFPTIVSMLNNEDLYASALPLIGNISVGNSEHISTLLNCDLFQSLMKLLTSEYTADVFWVLSNLVESTPHLTISLFNTEFIAQAVDMALSSPFEVRRESTFFLATLIIFTSIDDLTYFITEDVLSLLSEMLVLANSVLIVLRCLDAFIRLSTYSQSHEIKPELLEFLFGDDIVSKLNTLCESPSKIIEERAEFILNQLMSLEQHNSFIAGS